MVTIASNQRSDLPVGQAKRLSMSQKKTISIPMAKLVREYSAHMGGVDRLDQNVSACSAGLRGKKWYFPLISYFLNVCSNNAWLFAREGGCSSDLLSFTRTIVEELFKSHGTATKNPKRGKTLMDSRTSSSPTRHDNLGHNIAMPQPEKWRRCK